jgi:hypothetical protein
LKIFESLLDDILADISITDEIVDFLIINDLDEVHINLKYKEIHLIYDYCPYTKEKCLLQILNDLKEEVGVGTPRNGVLQLLKDILEYLKNMTQQEIDMTKNDPNWNKYNL